MIGESEADVANGGNKGLIAVRDAVVIFLVMLITNLAAQGYPPTVEATYTAALGSILTGLVSYMHAMGIKKPESATSTQ